MSSCFFMSTRSLLPEVYIIILSHVTMANHEFPVLRAETATFALTIGKNPLVRDGGLVKILGRHGASRVSLTRAVAALLELFDGFEIAFGPHELRQATRRVTVGTAKIRAQFL